MVKLIHIKVKISTCWIFSINILVLSFFLITVRVNAITFLVISHWNPEHLLSKFCLSHFRSLFSLYAVCAYKSFVPLRKFIPFTSSDGMKASHKGHALRRSQWNKGAFIKQIEETFLQIQSQSSPAALKRLINFVQMLWPIFRVPMTSSNRIMAHHSFIVNFAALDVFELQLSSCRYCITSVITFQSSFDFFLLNVSNWNCAGVSEK